MNSKTTKKTNLITKNNSNATNSNNKKFFRCCSGPTGTPLVAMNMNNHEGSVRPVRRFTDELKEPAFAYVAVGEKQGGMFSKMGPEAAALSDGGGESDDKEVKDGQKKKKKKDGHKKLMRIVKAILFETSLAKKLKKRRLKKKLKQASQGKLSTKPEKSFNENSIHQESQDYQHGRIFSTTSSFGSSSIITSSSVCSSSLSSNSKSLSDRNKSFRTNTLEKTVQKQNQDNMQEHRKGYNMQEHKKGCYPPDIACCFLLISLLVLVLWGKICSILCTSIWFFFVPRWTISKNSSVKMAIISPKAHTIRRRS